MWIKINGTPVQAMDIEEVCVLIGGTQSVY